MSEMSAPKIVAMYRIKNEERWIEKSLEAVVDICNEIVILDDGSTDDTIKICKTFDKVVDIHHQTGLPFDETRDKNTLLDMAKTRKPDFILTLDGDEIIQKHAKDILFEELTIIYPDSPMYEFQAFNIWDKPNQYRYDGIYSNLWAKKLIRMSKQPKDMHFKETQFPGNSHCPAIPQNAIGTDCSIRSKMKIFHYGNYDEKLRQQKYNFYKNIDPDNVDFDGYIHIISGKGKFSGKNGIELRTFPNDVFIKDIK